MPPQPVITDAEVRCWHCHKKFAVRLGSGSIVDCRHCGARNET